MPATEPVTVELVGLASDANSSFMRGPADAPAAIRRVLGDVIAVIQPLPAPVIGADIVEYNPRRDINEMTAAVAVKLVKELAAVMQ